MSSKYTLDKQEIETLKRAIEILDDINCDEYADNIRGILKEEGVATNKGWLGEQHHEWTPEDGKCPYCGGGNCKHWTGLGWTKASKYGYQPTDEGYKDG